MRISPEERLKLIELAEAIKKLPRGTEVGRNKLCDDILKIVRKKRGRKTGYRKPVHDPNNIPANNLMDN